MLHNLGGALEKSINPSADDKILAHSKFKTFSDDN